MSDLIKDLIIKLRDAQPLVVEDFDMCQSAASHLQKQADEIELLTAANEAILSESTDEIERLRAALDKACKTTETRAQVGRSIDYANGFNRGAQCQRLRATFARDEALRKDEG